MTIAELYELNEKFQKGAVQLSELIPTGIFAETSSVIIRNSRLMHEYLIKMISAKNQSNLGTAVERVEDCSDEIIFLLDQIEIANKNQSISFIDSFLKEGYDLISTYSACVNQLIKEKIPTED
jgi:hypothetical protein